MKLVIVFLLVGIIGLSSAAPHGLATKQDKLESLLGRLIRVAKEQDDDDDLEDIIAEKQDDDDDDDDALAKLIAKVQDDVDNLGDVLTILQDDNDGDSDQATIEDLLAELQDADDDDDQASIEDILAELQDDGDDDSVVQKENIFKRFFHRHGKSLLKHALHFIANEYGQTQDMDDGDDDLEDVIAKLQEDGDDDDLEDILAKLQDDDDGDSDQATIEDLLAKLQDADDDDDTADVNFFKKFIKKHGKKLLKHAVKHGAKYVANNYGTTQDDNDNQVNIEDILAELQDDGDDDSLANKQNFLWHILRRHGKSLLRHGLHYLANKYNIMQTQDMDDGDDDLEDVIAKLQEDGDGDDLEDILAKLQDDNDRAELQDDGDDDSVANKENIFKRFFRKHGKSLLRHALHFLASEYGKTQDTDDGEDLEDLIANLQGSSKKKSLAEELLEKLTSEK